MKWSNISHNACENLKTQYPCLASQGQQTNKTSPKSKMDAETTNLLMIGSKGVQQHLGMKISYSIIEPRGLQNYFREVISLKCWKSKLCIDGNCGEEWIWWYLLSNQVVHSMYDCVPQDLLRVLSRWLAYYRNFCQ